MRPALPELAGFYVDSVLYARDFAAAMSAEAAVAYLVPVLASCGYRYIHKSTTFGTEENTAPQRVCTAVTVCPIKNSSN